VVEKSLMAGMSFFCGTGTFLALDDTVKEYGMVWYDMVNVNLYSAMEDESDDDEDDELACV